MDVSRHSRSDPAPVLGNIQVAERLDEVARLLEAQDANPFRVRAYREAAGRLRELLEPVAQLLEAEGIAGLDRLPGIGEALARSIEQLTYNGRLGLLERLRGEAKPERLLSSVPGIGPELAGRIHHELGIETLEDLELAAREGRLARIPGLGPKRIQGIRDSLAGRLRRRRPVLPPARLTGEGPIHRPPPPVEELLDVDREYREAAGAGRLPRIAPRRFNPTGEAWLPILHTERGPRHYTALFSNTARAHELGTEHDWVVLYRDDHGGDGQWTVVTSASGPLRGRRIVRGREAECAVHFEQGDNQKMPLWEHHQDAQEPRSSRREGDAGDLAS
jgi:hypothetical protein